MQIIGLIFTGPRQYGDFAWMIEQPDYADALFIFNDNEEQFLEHRKNPRSAWGCAAGGGNAVIRPYQCKEPPRAAGIPTGARGSGYAKLTDPVKRVIDEAISSIRDLVNTGRYQQIFYSAAHETGELGTGIFHVDNDVKEYIARRIKSLSHPMIKPRLS